MKSFEQRNLNRHQTSVTTRPWVRWGSCTWYERTAVSRAFGSGTIEEASNGRAILRRAPSSASGPPSPSLLLAPQNVQFVWTGGLTTFPPFQYHNGRNAYSGILYRSTTCFSTDGTLDSGSESASRLLGCSTKHIINQSNRSIGTRAHVNV